MPVDRRGRKRTRTYSRLGSGAAGRDINSSDRIRLIPVVRRAIPGQQLSARSERGVTHSFVSRHGLASVSSVLDSRMCKILPHNLAGGSGGSIPEAARAQSTRPFRIKKWLLHLRVRQIDGKSDIEPSPSTEYCHFGSSFLIRLSDISSPQPHGQIKDADHGFARSPTR